MESVIRDIGLARAAERNRMGSRFYAGAKRIKVNTRRTGPSRELG